MKSSAERLKEIIGVFHRRGITKNFTPENLRLCLEELGPTFIKMGQIFASREDLIPKEFCTELTHLRNSVKPMDFTTVTNILEEEYGCSVDDVFKSISDKPIGSASIAQVHKAILKDGSVVAVKVQREHISELMAKDVTLLKKAISVLQLNKIFGNIVDFNDFIDEMYERAKEEMDFFIEKRHIIEFASNNSDLVYMKPLKVYERLSTSKVLVMEFIDGYKISDVNDLTNDGYSMDEIGEKLAHNYVKQAIDDGFYHADPHSDNIKIVDGKITYLDFGMMGRLGTHNRELLEECIQAIVLNDIGKIAHVLIQFDTQKGPVDFMQLKNDIRLLLERNKTMEIKNIDIKAFVGEMFSLLQNNQITIPKEITMLARGIVVIEGTLEEVSPNINLMEVLTSRFHYGDAITGDKIKSFAVNGLKSGADLVLIPNELLSTLKGINSGELRFNIELNDSKHQIEKIEKIVHLIIVTVLDLAFIMGTSTMIVNINGKMPFMFYCYLIGAIICTVWLLIKLILSKFDRY